MKLTAIKCKNAKYGKDGKSISDGHGLYLQLAENGGKYWRYKYRIDKKEKVLAFGVYPEVSLAEAREKHQEAHKLVSQGIDPKALKQELELQKEAEKENTFELVAREWYEREAPNWTKGHADTILQRLEKDIFPEIGSMPISSIKAKMILEMAEKLQQRGANELAKRSISMCEKVFQLAIITERADRNVASDVKGLIKPAPVKHYAAIEASELPEFLTALRTNKAGLHRQTILAVEMMMFTFVRTKELIGAEWKEFDLKDKTWLIPASRMKMKKEHIVPLSDQVIEILKELRNLHSHPQYIFAGRNRRAKHMSNTTILMALRRMGYGGIMTGHGFRSLAMSTIIEKLGYRYEVPDLQLAHAKKGDVEKAYNRAKFLDERKIMMQEWADYIDGLAK